MLLSLILAFYSRFHFKGNMYLAIFFFLINLEEFAIYALHITKDPLLSTIVLLNFAPLFFLIGTAFYFYIRSVISNSARVNRSDLWHLLPTIIIFLILTPYYIQPFELKLSLAKAIGKDMHAYLHGFPILIPQAYINLLRSVSIFGYICYALYIYYKNLPRIRLHSVISIQQRRSFELWLLFTSGCSFILSLAYLVASIELVVIDKIAFFESAQIIIALIFLSLSIILLCYPHILYGLPSYQSIIRYYSAGSENRQPDKAESNPDLHLFTDTYIQYIGKRIHSVVINREYCQPDFSRAKLSILTEIPLHHLSYYFSNILTIKFTDWKNNLRIEYAKQLIATDLIKKQNLDDISSQSGFRNRQNFITSFKKITAISPAEYLNMLKNETQEESQQSKQQN